MKHIMQLPDINVAAAGTSVVPNPITFTFEQLPAQVVANMQSQFNQYRIRGVKYMLKPRQPVNTSMWDTTTGAVIDTFVPEVISVIDHTELAFPTATTPSYASLLNYATMKLTRGNRPHSRFVKPTVLVPAYVSGAITDTGGAGTLTGYGVQPKRAGWIDIAEDHVPHLGLMIGFDNQGTQTVSMGVYVNYYIEFRGRKS